MTVANINGNNYSFTMPASNIKITVQFKVQTFLVEIHGGVLIPGDGIIKDLNGSYIVNYGTTVTAKPFESMYEIAGWYVNGEIINTSGDYTFTVYKNTALDIFFNDSVYLISFEMGPAAEAFVEGGVYQKEGDTVIITFTVHELWEIENVYIYKVGDLEKVNENTYKFTMLGYNTTITVNLFTHKSHFDITVVNATADNSGAVVEKGTGEDGNYLYEIFPNNDIYLSVIAKDGFKVSDWLVDGVSTGINSNYFSIIIYKDCVIEAVLVPNN